MELIGQHPAQAAVPRERTPVPIEQLAGWAPEPVWTIWRREKCIASAEIRTPDRLGYGIITGQCVVFRFDTHYETRTYLCISGRRRTDLFSCVSASLHGHFEAVDSVGESGGVVLDGTGFYARQSIL
jgi:hypothetical protein